MSKRRIRSVNFYSTAWAEAKAEALLEADKTQKRLDAVKKELKKQVLAAIRSCGRATPNSRTMKVLDGVLHQLQGIYPTEAVVNQDRAKDFLRRCPTLGRKLFERVHLIRLRPGSLERIHENPGALATFNQCVTRRAQKPRVKVVKLKKRVSKSMGKAA